MPWLSVIPKSALALAVAVLGALLIAQTLVAERSAGRLAELRAETAAAAASASERERDKERQWANKHQEAIHAYQVVAEQMVADRAAADSVSERLRASARDRAGRRVCAGATPAGSGASAESPDFLLSELFALADRRAGEMAQHADAARAAGLACERAYDALR